MEKIAIIGFSCLFPDANNPQEFWQNLINQKDATSSITIEETDIDPNIFYNPTKGTADKIYSLKGGFIRNFQFDTNGYNLPPSFLEQLDNTFKWSLYTAKQALQHSGYLEQPNTLKKTGVILGTLSLPTKSSNQLFAPLYQQALTPAIQELLQQKDFDLTQLSPSSPTSIHNAMISGLPTAIIAQALSLSNIHFCIDAACSSPQYAARLASHYLWTHKADLMLAGGISCADPLFLRMLFSGIQGYPEDNDISRPLDKTSRGMLTAEGTGMVVLKRYSDALRDGDRIYATICGNGLSNDGKGKHLLSPNTKGQTLAFQRAYDEAGITPRDIDYMECHATGTLLGDTTEFNSIETFFGQHQATPLVGSVKSNVGHLLTSAGAVSLIKVLLSMNEGVIPATINVTQPQGDSNNVISPQNLVTSNTNWADKPVKRAAISAFGLGGTNAHMILEQGNTNESVTPAAPMQPAKVAIVGMDALFGECDGLDAFERSIYEGKQHFIPLPPQRWHGMETQTELLQKYGLKDGRAPQGAYISEFDIDTVSSKIPPNELDKLNQQQLLMLKVAERALQDADIQPGGNVAVVIAAETEFSVHQLQQRWNSDWQVKEGLTAGEIALPEEKVNELATIVKDSIHHPVATSEYVSYIANIMASRISSLWDFTAPVFTMTAGENSTFKVLEVAQHLLTTGEADAVLVGAVDLAGGVENVLLRNQFANINEGVNTLSYDQKADGWMVGEGAGAVVLKRHDTAIQNQDKIYAAIDAISFTQQGVSGKDNLGEPDAGFVNQVSQQALLNAGVKTTDINYLEVVGSGIPQTDEAEITGLIQAYANGSNNLTCAIGSVKANIGHTYVASGIASLIKTALCLYYRYIPATPKWTGVKNQEQWHGSPFYVATESRPWFLEKQATKRMAAINGMGIDGSYAHVILSEFGVRSSEFGVGAGFPRPEGRSSEFGVRSSEFGVGAGFPRPEGRSEGNKFLQQTPFYLFPIVGNTTADLFTQIDTLETTINNGTSLANAANQALTKYQQSSLGKYTLVILAHNQKELTREITSARKGIETALQTGKDWQTPLGSYFSANPLGKTGEIAYVYPAAINSYLGIARNLFRLFPKIHDDIAITNLQDLVADISQKVFPRSLNKLSSRQLETLEKQFLDDSLAIFDVDMLFTRFITQIIRDDFQIKPKFAFGYSLGETSMMSAMGVWDNFTQGILSLHQSPLFANRLAGEKQAVRQFWHIPPNHTPDNHIWANYVLVATPSYVQEAIKNVRVAVLKELPKVFLTQINTPEEVVIAGDPKACDRIIQIIGCNAFRAPFDHVIHCPAMQSEFGEIARVNTLKMQQQLPETTLYSAAAYTPVQLESGAIAHSIATGLCQQLDFPRLVNRLYADGARIFIETGAGNVCSRWIDKNLSQHPHLTVSLNRRGLDDHAGLIKALAKLISHQVDVDLSPLISTEPQTTKKAKLTQKKVILGGESIIDKIVTEENKKLFHNIAKKTSHLPKTQPIPQNIETEKVISLRYLSNQITTPNTHNTPNPTIKTPPQSKPQPKTPPMPTTTTTTLKPHHQQLHKNNTILHQTHNTFLQSRQEFSQQMSQIIQLQIACAENLLEEVKSKK
ncbi:MAG: PfaB family protein [Calothrix sp. MO_192.B10]|nr:PfaB family protein [Calothrix sp. MO_192.B10]